MDKKGQSLVEFALIIPIFLLIVFAIIQFAIILSTYLSLTNLSREGARYSAINYTQTDTVVANYIRGNPATNYTGGINPSNLWGGDFTSVSISPAYGSSTRIRGNTITVSLQYDLRGEKPKILLPTNFGFGSLRITFPTAISSATSMRME